MQDRDTLVSRGGAVAIKMMKLRTYAMIRGIWRIWAKSLGEKVGETDRQANSVAVIRTFWWLLHVATCIFIILNAIANHGWNLL